ncbi:hypothetical protein BH09PLA1_BH09PLA1_02390 [soil metagenome]
MAFSYNRRILWFVLALTLTGCVSVPQPRPGGSDERAVEILRQAADAHGLAALQQVHDVNVRFEGTWNQFVARVQPVLVDARFRGSSEERFLLNEAAVGQAHYGPSGTKQVYRDKTTTRVWYNGQESNSSEVRDAAALVSDNYRMFLFGPYFFMERPATVQFLGIEKVDGSRCDSVLAVLRPGIGNSLEDRVVISVDQDHHWVRRVRITVDGLASTRGAIVDIYLRDHVRIGGIVWPTTFFEELKQPFNAPVHRWRLTAIDYDRGLKRSTLDGPTFKGAAARDAGTKFDGAQIQ